MRPAGVWLDGTPGTRVEADYHPRFSLAGDVDIRVLLGTQWDHRRARILVNQASATTRAYVLRTISWDSHYSEVHWYDQTITFFNVYWLSVPTTALTPGLWVRFTVDLDNGAGGRTGQLLTSLGGSSWTLRQTITLTPASAPIRTVAGPMSVGLGVIGNDMGREWRGIVRRVMVYDGIGGTLVADMNPADASSLAARSWVSSTTGERWTLIGKARLVAHPWNEARPAMPRAARHAIPIFSLPFRVARWGA